MNEGQMSMGANYYIGGEEKSNNQFTRALMGPYTPRCRWIGFVIKTHDTFDACKRDIQVNQQAISKNILLLQYISRECMCIPQGRQ